MRVNIVPPQIFLPRDAVKLGRFVTSFEHPHQNYIDPLPASQPPELVSLRVSYSGEHSAGSGFGFSSTLTSVVSAGFSKRAKAKVRVVTDQVKTYILDNSDGWFEEATRATAARAWIERNIDRGRDIYLIVGFHTVTDASISQESTLGEGVSGQINVPVGLSLAAAGVVVPLGDLLDPGIAIEKQGLDGAASQYKVRGEQVCALEYRKIRHKWFSSKEIDKSRLSRVCHWPSVEQSRDEEGEEDDMIEVELADVEGPERGWDKEVVEGDVVFFQSGL